MHPIDTLEQQFLAGSRPRAEGVGPDLRALRKARGVTLAALSAAAGRSVGWLSEVERGLSEPTLADLRRIADHLFVPLGIFFGDPETPKEEQGVIVRRGSGRVLSECSAGLGEELLSPDLRGEFELLRRTFAPGVGVTKRVSGQKEQAGYVIAGEFEIQVDGRWFELHQGDSIRLKGEPYFWRNTGDQDAVLIWVTTAPVY